MTILKMYTQCMRMIHGICKTREITKRHGSSLIPLLSQHDATQDSEPLVNNKEDEDSVYNTS